MTGASFRRGSPSADGDCQTTSTLGRPASQPPEGRLWDQLPFGTGFRLIRWTNKLSLSRRRHTGSGPGGRKAGDGQTRQRHPGRARRRAASDRVLLSLPAQQRQATTAFTCADRLHHADNSIRCGDFQPERSLMLPYDVDMATFHGVPGLKLQAHYGKGLQDARLFRMPAASYCALQRQRRPLTRTTWGSELRGAGGAAKKRPGSRQATVPLRYFEVGLRQESA